MSQDSRWRRHFCGGGFGRDLTTCDFRSGYCHRFTSGRVALLSFTIVWLFLYVDILTAAGGWSGGIPLAIILTLHNTRRDRLRLVWHVIPAGALEGYHHVVCENWTNHLAVCEWLRQRLTGNNCSNRKCKLDCVTLFNWRALIILLPENISLHQQLHATNWRILRELVHRLHSEKSNLDCVGRKCGRAQRKQRPGLYQRALFGTPAAGWPLFLSIAW